MNIKAHLEPRVYTLALYPTIIFPFIAFLEQNRKHGSYRL